MIRFTRNRLATVIVPLAAILLVSASQERVRGTDRPVDFSNEIRPILSDKCFRCHGPAVKDREADLRLDEEEAAKEDAIVPGKPDESEVFARITSADQDERMPPADSGKELSTGEIELIRRWIEQGAPWKQHWAFVAPQRSDLPQVKQSDWPRNPIDHFVLARLEAEAPVLLPSPEADAVTLVRRVTFDLTGLPPTIEEVDAFLADRSPQAYERLVDRLLESPRYGEHMARFWLDAARYGDTHGLHLDNYREIWPYRDWVVKAFNDNLPFDRFTIEQLAGDLLPDPTLDQRVATGFNRCHVTTSEGGSIKEEVYVRNVVDRVVTNGTVFMGMTFECTRCHDHKYDPFTMNDFYSMFAYFNNLDANPLDGNKAQHPPVIKVPLPGAEAELARVRAETSKVQQQIDERRKQVTSSDAFANWQQQAAASVGKQGELPSGMVAYYPLDEGSGDMVASAVSGLPAGKVTGKVNWKSGQHGGALDFDGKTYVDVGDVADFERDQGFSYGAWVQPRNNSAGAVLARMNDGNAYRGYDMYLAANRVAVHIIHRWSDNAVKITTKKGLAEGKWQHVFATYDGSSKAAGVKIYLDGKEQPVDVNVDNLSGTIKSKVPLRIGSRTPGSVYQGLLDDVRVYDRTLTAEQVASLAGADPIGPILAIEPSGRTPEQTEQLVSFYIGRHDEPTKKLQGQLAALRKAESAADAKSGTTLIWKELAKPRAAYYLKRGEYDQRGDQVSRRTPGSLPPMAPDLPQNRLGFAKWLVDPAHPLTARVTVNRFWQQAFGTGIVKTAEDFGSQGEPPSHPELLDWLAVQFMQDGWDMKATMKRIVTSATYRQSSHVTKELWQRDPENRLLARGPRFRLDGEMIRDQALAVSGLLVEKVGGPSVKPPQPDGLWFAVGYTRSNTARFKADAGPDKVHRRTLYTFVKRTAPPPQMSTFDAPSRESCSVRRERTNTPLQALLLMNDPQYVEAARGLAQRTLREGGASVPARAAHMFRLCTARQPDTSEMESLVEDFHDHLAVYQQDAEAAGKLLGVGVGPPEEPVVAPELAAWIMVANLILNLDEVVNKN